MTPLANRAPSILGGMHNDRGATPAETRCLLLLESNAHFSITDSCTLTVNGCSTLLQISPKNSKFNLKAQHFLGTIERNGTHVLLDGVLALPEGVPQLDRLVTGSRHDLPVSS